MGAWCKESKNQIVEGLICPNCGNEVYTTPKKEYYECVNCRKIESSASSFLPKQTKNFKDGDWVYLVREDGVIFETFQYNDGWNGKNGFVIEAWKPFGGDYVWDKHYGLCVVIENNEEKGIKIKQLFCNKTYANAPLKDLEPFF